MIAAFSRMLCGTFLETSQVSSDDLETLEQSPFSDECHPRSSLDPVGYSKGAPDPKHHGQAMQSAMKNEWIRSQTREMYGLWRKGVFQKVLRSSFTLQDCVFTRRFHYKIKRKEEGCDKCTVTVRLVGQGQHMCRKGEDGVGDDNDPHSPVPAVRRKCICLFR